MSPKFNTPYDREKTPEAPNSGEVITEQTGYISAQQQIEELILAGERLNQLRSGYEFDAEEEIPDDYYNPLAQPGIDLVDAQNYLEDTQVKLDAAKKAAEPTPPVESEPANPAPTVADSLSPKG